MGLLVSGMGKISIWALIAESNRPNASNGDVTKQHLCFHVFPMSDFHIHSFVPLGEGTLGKYLILLSLARVRIKVYFFINGVLHKKNIGTATTAS
jgi:hypothetical protein